MIDISIFYIIYRKSIYVKRKLKFIRAVFKELSPYEAFSAFFKETAGREMDMQESSLIKEIIEEASCDRQL